jgi:hypothetical protein
MSERRTIYVRLIDELVDVWRPVEADPVDGGVYRICEQPYDREIERWEFTPDELVLCERISLSAGTVLAATKRA